MHVFLLKYGQSVDLNVQHNRVILSVGDDDRVEYDFDTETQAYDAADEYCTILRDFLGLVRSYSEKRAGFKHDVLEAYYGEQESDE